MEGDAGTRRLNRTDVDQRSDTREQQRPSTRRSDLPDAASELTDPLAHASAAGAGAECAPDQKEPATSRRRTRFGRRSFVASFITLLALTGCVGGGGYLAARAHDRSDAAAREDSTALERAKECVAATQAPDVKAMTASQTKVIECATGDFGVQANLFASVLVEAYQAANVSVQVSDMRGAVEKHQDDGSVDVLIAVRVKVTNSQAADQEQGYRLRVNMAPVDGTYKINRLDQVTS